MPFFVSSLSVGIARAYPCFTLPFTPPHAPRPLYHPCTRVRVERPPVLVTSIRVGPLSERELLPPRLQTSYPPLCYTRARPRPVLPFTTPHAPRPPHHPCTTVLPPRRPTPLRRPPNLRPDARARALVPYCRSPHRTCLAPNCVHAELVRFVFNAQACARSWKRSLLSRLVSVLSHPHCPLLPSLVLSFSPSPPLPPDLPTLRPRP